MATVRYSFICVKQQLLQVYILSSLSTKLLLRVGMCWGGEKNSKCSIHPPLFSRELQFRDPPFFVLAISKCRHNKKYRK